MINHGIDYDRNFSPHAESTEPYILSVGALKMRKGYHLSILAFALVRERFPNLKYIIVGDQSDSSYFERLKELVKNNKLENHIEFKDNIDQRELKKLYSEARLFVLSSINIDHHFEGFGLVFLEAAAAGLPVVGTTNNGIADAISDGYNGILVPQDSIELLSKAMIQILESTNYESMSENSYSWAKDHSLGKMIGQYLNAYGL